MHHPPIFIRDETDFSKSYHMIKGKSVIYMEILRKT